MYAQRTNEHLRGYKTEQKMNQKRALHFNSR